MSGRGGILAHDRKAAMQQQAGDRAVESIVARYSFEDRSP